MKKKTILLTGAGGYVAKYVLKELLRQGFDVSCFVRRSVEFSPGNSRVRIFRGDLLDRESLENATKRADAVIHLAAAVRVNDPKTNYACNYVGTRNLLDACKKNGVERVIYMSSVSAIRKRKGSYGKSKRMGEEAVRKSGITYTILRPPTIYGAEGQGIGNIIRYISAFPFFIPLVGSGNNTQQPVSVEDVARVVVGCIDNEKTFNKTYSLAGADVIRFRDLVKMLSAGMGIKKRMVPVPAPICSLAAMIFEATMKKPPFTREHVRSLTEDTMMDITPLVKDTGYSPVKLERVIRKLTDDMHKNRH